MKVLIILLCLLFCCGCATVIKESYLISNSKWVQVQVEKQLIGIKVYRRWNLHYWELVFEDRCDSDDVSYRVVPLYTEGK